MTKYVTVAFILCACALMTSAQFNHLGLGFSDGYLATNFGPPSLNTLSAAAARDPRANTGPVVFPPSPPGDPSQSSGVVPGASGYGFQPPSSQGSSFHKCKRQGSVRTSSYNSQCEGIPEQRKQFLPFPGSYICDHLGCLVSVWRELHWLG